MCLMLSGEKEEGMSASDTWATDSKTEGRCFARSEAFSGEIVSPLANCKFVGWCTVHCLDAGIILG